MSQTEILSSARVAVVVVNWNGKDYSLECLKSLQEQLHVEINVVLVDNGSTDGSVSSIRKEYPEVVIVESEQNLGYAGGNNLGMVLALEQGFEYVLVLNNDTVLATDCVYQLIMDLERHPEAAAAAPKSYYLESPHQIYFAGGAIRRTGQTIHIGGGCGDGPEFCHTFDTEWLNGCAIMFRSRALRDVGLFEPKFFLLFEETDWSLRARNVGYRLRFVPQAKLWHKVSPSFGASASTLYLYYHTRNQLLWIERSYPFPEKLALYCFALMRGAAEALFRSKGLDPGSARARRRAIGQGILDYFLRRFGKQMNPQG
jgi:GT2 family glycosyltransferase